MPERDPTTGRFVSGGGSSGGVNLGSAYGQIVISDNIDAAMQNAGRAFDNALSTIGGRMDQIGQTISGVGQQITLATAPGDRDWETICP